MKEFIKNIETNIVDNMHGVVKSISYEVMFWVTFKWFFAIDLPYIMFPVLSIPCNMHTFEICYKIGGMFGSLIAFKIIGEIFGYFIGLCILHNQHTPENDYKKI